MTSAMALARHIAVIDPDLVQETKRAINRTFEIMGFSKALEEALAIDLGIEGEGSADKRQFMDIARKDGLRAAIAWRDARFAQKMTERLDALLLGLASVLRRHGAGRRATHLSYGELAAAARKTADALREQKHSADEPAPVPVANGRTTLPPSSASGPPAASRCPWPAPPGGAIETTRAAATAPA